MTAKNIDTTGLESTDDYFDILDEHEGDVALLVDGGGTDVHAFQYDDYYEDVGFLVFGAYEYDNAGARGAMAHILEHCDDYELEFLPQTAVDERFKESAIGTDAEEAVDAA